VLGVWSRIVRPPRRLDEVAFFANLNTEGNVAGVLGHGTELGEHFAYGAEELLRLFVYDITVQ
jgi:hypothetical protein